MIRALCTVSGCGAAAIDLVIGPGAGVARVACDRHRNTVAGDLVAGGAGAYAVALDVCTVMHVLTGVMRDGDPRYLVTLAADVVSPGTAMVRCLVTGPAPDWIRAWLTANDGADAALVEAGTCDRCRLPGPMYVLDYAGPATATSAATAYAPARYCHRH